MKRFMIMAAVFLLTAMVWYIAIAEEALHPVIMISEVMASNDSVATYRKQDNFLFPCRVLKRFAVIQGRPANPLVTVAVADK